jgi:integrase/recombinase XerD
MKTHDARNERIKRQYLAFLKEAKGYSETSLDGVVTSIHRFEAYTRFTDFRRFHVQQAVAFKTHLGRQTNSRTGAVLSKSTLLSTLKALKAFFQWLAGQPGYKSCLTYADAEYFNLSEKETRVARTYRDQRAPTLEQIRHVIVTMPHGAEIDRRNRALIAFTILTGARDGAIASLKLKHIDIIEGRLDQDAREVKTKFSKTIVTYFFPVGDDLRAIVFEWVEFLRVQKLWGPDDPLFPATHVALGDSGHFEVHGIARAHWRNAGPIRLIFRQAFERAGIPYANPHSFRATLAGLGEKLCRSPEEFKAWSQNLGHEGVLTTFRSYGEVSREGQARIIRSLTASEAVSENQKATRVLEVALAMARGGAPTPPPQQPQRRSNRPLS